MTRFVLALSSLLAAGWLFAAPAAAAGDADAAARTFEGTVGAAPVVMSLDISDDTASGQYFYRGRWFDIDLSGDVKKGVLKLESRATGDRLTLAPEGAGYAGSLTTSKGKTSKIELRAVGREAAAGLPAEIGAGFTLYEKIRLAGLALKPQGTETKDRKTLRWLVEPVSKLRLFRIESGYSASAMEAMNRTLTQIQWRNVSNYFGCLSSEGGPGIESETESPFLSERYVSFAISDSWDCAGAAHPDEGMEGRSFDAASGKELELDDLLKFCKSVVPKKDSDAWLDYRSKVFAPAIVSLLKRLHPKEMKASKKEDDCNYADPEVWSFPSWRLNATGLYVGASFPRVARVCDNPEWSIIPYADLVR